MHSAITGSKDRDDARKDTLIQGFFDVPPGTNNIVHISRSSNVKEFLSGLPDWTEISKLPLNGPPVSKASATSRCAILCYKSFPP